MGIGFWSAVIAGITGFITASVTGGIENIWQAIAEHFDTTPGIDVTVAQSNLGPLEVRLKAGCGYILPTTVPEVLTALPSSTTENFDTWAREHGGVDAQCTLLEITIHGESADAVVLHGLRGEITRARKPLSGVFLSIDEGCANCVTMIPRNFEVDLDADPPKISFYPRPPDLVNFLDQLITSDERISNADGLENFPYAVTSGTPEVFDILAHTDTCDCEWHLVLDYTDDGERRSAVIDLAGQPLRTTADDAATASIDWQSRKIENITS